MSAQMGEHAASAEKDAPRWHNADGTTSPIVKATADAALPEPGPSQEFLQALVAAEQDRLRSEGWQACVAYLQAEYNRAASRAGTEPVVMLDGEQLWFLANRHDPYRTRVIPSGSAAGGETDV